MTVGGRWVGRWGHTVDNQVLFYSMQLMYNALSICCTCTFNTPTSCTVHQKFTICQGIDILSLILYGTVHKVQMYSTLISNLDYSTIVQSEHIYTGTASNNFIFIMNNLHEPKWAVDVYSTLLKGINSSPVQQELLHLRFPSYLHEAQIQYSTYTCADMKILATVQWCYVKVCRIVRAL